MVGRSGGDVAGNILWSADAEAQRLVHSRPPAQQHLPGGCGGRLLQTGALQSPLTGHLAHLTGSKRHAHHISSVA